MPIRVTRALAGAPALALSAGLLAAAACRPAGATSSVTLCAVGDTALLRGVLYFGRNTPGGSELSDSAWQQYGDEMLTPRFPAGPNYLGCGGPVARRQRQGERERVTTCSRF